MKSFLKLLAVIVAFILAANYAEKKREKQWWENAAKEYREREAARQKPVPQPEPPKTRRDIIIDVSARPNAYFMRVV